MVFNVTIHIGLQCREKGICIGMNGHISKQIDVDALFKTIENILK